MDRHPARQTDPRAADSHGIDRSTPGILDGSNLPQLSELPRRPAFEHHLGPSFTGVGIQQTGPGNIQVGRDLIIHASSTHDSLELDAVADAAFNASSKQHLPLCLENTRQSILSWIEKWADSDDDKSIFWLKGMAGTGKSTIARTIARKYHDFGRLGASYFFSRGGGDLASMKRFVSTIASQLANTSQAARQAIKEAAVSSNYTSLGLLDQWNKLVLEPLSKLEKQLYPSPVILVIDALDECDDEDEIRLLVRCLTTTTVTQGVRVRIFITSRPDQPVNVGFSNVSIDAYQGFILHDIEQSIVNQDLMLFYRYKLTETRQRYGLSDHFLSHDTIQYLVERSHGLFIHAATVCRYIHGTLPNERLSQLIKDDRGLVVPEKALDHLYTTILMNSIKGLPEEDDETARKLSEAKIRSIFAFVVGSIVVLSDVMTYSDLAKLLNSSEDDIVQTLHCLHSVLDVPEDRTQPIRLLHPSFRDFLLDPSRCTADAFFIDAQMAHHRLYKSCLHLIRDHIHMNICGIKQPGTRVHSVPKADIKKSIPNTVQYACRYWIDHLLKSGADLYDEDEVLVFFQTRFLHWLEALAWTGRLSDGIRLLKHLETEMGGANITNAQNKYIQKARKRSLKLLSKIKSKWKRAPSQTSQPQSESLYRTVYDAMRFFLAHCSVIEQAPLQTYCSALVFSPDQSIIRRLYLDSIPSWIERPLPVLARNWSLHLQTLSHPDWVTAVAFSPDGQLVASGSYDEVVRLWDATTGTPRQTLEGHTGRVNAVAFSPDGRLIASGSVDNTVRLWDTTRTTLRQTLEGHTESVAAVAFSPDDRLVASGSHDGTVQLWDAATGTSRQKFESHRGLVNAVAFSPDSRLVASGSEDKTVRLWDAATGTPHQTFESYTAGITAVAFSPDGRLVASGSADTTIRLWNTATGKPWQTFKSQYGRVNAVTFSPNGRLVASCSNHGTIQLWDTSTGKPHQMFYGHSHYVTDVAFSPNGQLIASSSNDQTVRLWVTATDTQHQTPERYGGSITAVTYSPDGRLVAFGLHDGTVRLWDAATGTVRQTFEDHTQWISAISFSLDSRLIASASYHKTPRIRDVATGTRCQTFESDDVEIAAVAFSPDGQLVASGLTDGTVRFWDTATAMTRQAFKGHTERVNAIAFSPDGQLVASGSEDWTVQLWDAATGTQHQTFESHDGEITAVAFSPDGRLIASGSSDETVRVWDAVTGLENCVLQIASTLRYLAYSPCGTHLVTDRGLLQVPHASSFVPSICYLFATNTWIQKEDQDFLKLHADYQEHFLFILNNSIGFLTPVNMVHCLKLTNTL